jgi:hypothetical protein
MNPSPTFVATFTDGVSVRMTTFCGNGKLNLARGKKLARYAYEQRTGKTPPDFKQAHFERGGAVLQTYAAAELIKEK